MSLFCKKIVAVVAALSVLSGTVVPAAAQAQQTRSFSGARLSLTELQAESERYQRFERNVVASLGSRGLIAGAPAGGFMPKAPPNTGKPAIQVRSFSDPRSVVYKNGLRSATAAGPAITYQGRMYIFAGGTSGAVFYVVPQPAPPCTYTFSSNSSALTGSFVPNPSSAAQCDTSLTITASSSIPLGDYTVTINAVDSQGHVPINVPYNILLTVMSSQAFRHGTERPCDRCSRTMFGMSIDPGVIGTTEQGVPEELQQGAVPESSITNNLPANVSAGVDVTTGESWYQRQDIALPGPLGLRFSRFYGNQSSSGGDLGAHWRHNYSAFLDLSQMSTTGAVRYVDAQDMSHYFSNVTAGGSAYDGISNMTLALDAGATQYTLTAFNGDVSVFNAKGELLSLADRIGNKQTLVRDTQAGHNDRITKVHDALGRALCFSYDGSNRITRVLAWFSSTACPSSPPANAVKSVFAYDSAADCVVGDLCSATESDRQTWMYHYLTTDSAYPTNVTTILDPLGNMEAGFSYVAAANQTPAANVVYYACAGGSPNGDPKTDCSPYQPYSTRLGSNVLWIPFTYADGITGLGRSGAYDLGGIAYDVNTLMPTAMNGPLCGCAGDQPRFYTYDQFDRVTSIGDNGAGNGPPHSYTYTYGRDGVRQNPDGTTATLPYPGPTQVSENFDAGSTFRTMTMHYYPIGDPRQDLVNVRTYPSVDTPGQSKTVTDTYSTSGLLVRTDETGYSGGTQQTHTRRYTYDLRGRILTQTGPRTGQQTTFGYFSDTDADLHRAGQLANVTNMLGQAIQFASASATGFTSYDPFDSPQSVVDENGALREYQYDGAGRKIAETLKGASGDAADLTTKWSYDAAGRLSGVTFPTGNALAYARDQVGRLSNIARADASGLQHEALQLTYDFENRLNFRNAFGCSTPSVQCSAGSGWQTSEPFSMRYLYNEYGSSQYMAVVLGNVEPMLLQFDGAGFLYGVNDGNHFAFGSTPPSSQYLFVRDPAGRLTAINRMNPAAPNGYMSQFFSHDTADNLTQSVDANGNTTTYAYDDFFRLRKEVSPVTHTTTRTYDASGNVLSVTNANGATTTSTYDLLDRKTGSSSTGTVNGSPVTETLSYGYDNPGSAFGIGRLTSMALRDFEWVKQEEFCCSA